MQTESFIRQAEVLATRIPISKTAYNNGIKTGRYPSPVKLSERTAAYRKSDIDLCCLMLSEGYVWRERNHPHWIKRLNEMLEHGIIDRHEFDNAMVKSRS